MGHETGNIDGSNSFPEGDNGILNVELSRWHEGRKCYISAKFVKYSSPILTVHENGRLNGGEYKMMQARCGKYGAACCQEQGNSLTVHFSGRSMSRDFHEMGYAQMVTSKTGNSLQGRAMPNSHHLGYYMRRDVPIIALVFSYKTPSTYYSDIPTFFLNNYRGPRTYFNFLNFKGLNSKLDRELQPGPMLNCSIYENSIKIELDNNSTSPFFNYLLLNTLEIKKIEFFKLLILESNYTYNPFKLGVHLAVYPNPPYKKYNGMTKYLAEQPIVYSDQ